MNTEAYRDCSYDVRQTIVREARAAQTRWELALAFATIVTLALAALTFAALNMIWGPTASLLPALILHAVAVWFAHNYYHSDPEDAHRATWGLCALAGAVAGAAFDCWRAMEWSDGAVLPSVGVACLEFIAVLAAGAATGLAHRALDEATDYTGRAHRLFDACERNPRPANVYANVVLQTRRELESINDVPRRYRHEHVEAKRREKAAHVQHWLNLLETHATAEQALADDAEERGEPIPDAVIGHLPPRPVPVQPELVPDADAEEQAA